MVSQNSCSTSSKIVCYKPQLPIVRPAVVSKYYKLIGHSIEMFKENFKEGEEYEVIDLPNMTNDEKIDVFEYIEILETAYENMD